MPESVLAEHPTMYRVLFKALPVAMVVIAASFAFAVYLVTHNNNRLNEISRQGVQAHDALCAQQASLREAVRESVRYLADVKAGRRKPIAGFSEADVLAAVARQQATLKAYDNLNC